jgi:uncharacterized membrane protein HdeD (DUF308 family)
MTTSQHDPATTSIRAGVLGPLRRTWRWVLADGLLGIVVGVLALAWPGVTVLTLAILLGLGLLAQGVAQLAAGWSVQRGTPGRGWLVVFGLLALVAGVVCLFRPGVGLLAIVIGVAVWFFAAGVNDFVAAITLREGRVWNIVVGALSIVAGATVVAQPQTGLSTVALITGISFLVRGLGETVLALRLRSTVLST